MEAEPTPKYEENVSDINYNVPPEPPLSAPPILDVSQPLHETPQSSEVPNPESNLNGAPPPSYNGTVLHPSSIIPQPLSHEQNVEEETRQSLEEPPRVPQNVYQRLNVHDVLPLEIARARLLNLIVEHFIEYHIIPVSASSLSKDKKRQRLDMEEMGKVAYEGDPNYVLPLLFVVNAYETLVAEVNARIAQIEGLQGKSIGLALEAAGGLYRRLIEKYPKSGSLTSFKRREMASAEEARKRFPQLVGSDEKRVRFIVVHGLELVERSSTMSTEDAEWFKRVTGRPEPILYPSDYKFFSQRTKTRRSGPTPVAQPALMEVLRLSNLAHQTSTQSQQAGSPQSDSRSPSHSQPTPSMLSQFSQPSQTSGQSLPLALSPPSSRTQARERSQQLALQNQPETPITPHVTSHHQLELMGHLAQVMNQNSTPRSYHPLGIAKYCDECGAQFLREASKFCSECGTRRYSS